MKFVDFEYVLSPERMGRYVNACNGDSKKAMTLYRYNLQLSQEMFTVISCFEVALRNAIDRQLRVSLGNDWLRDAILPDGIFKKNSNFNGTTSIIEKAYLRLKQNNAYTHTQLLSAMEFGIWKYMFSTLQYRATGQSLLKIFPYKQRSTKALQINQAYIYNELDKVNKLRNRIAHHETICFVPPTITPDVSYILNEYQKIQVLFAWMGIDSHALLYGLDHVQQVCNKIDALK